MRSTVFRFPLAVAILSLAAIGGIDVSLAISDEQVNTDIFAMHTEVFVGTKKQAILQTETYFHGNKIYDTITTDPDSVTMKFDLDGKVVYLLDPVSETRTTLTFDEINNFQSDACAAVQLEAKNGLLVFLANPRFQREFDAGAKTQRLTSPWLTYEAEGHQAPRNLVNRYADFASWSTKLSTVLVQGPPAQARIELNQLLKKRNWQVVRVTRTGGPKAAALGVVRSEHAYRYAFTEGDENFIQDVEKNLKAYRDVEFFAFRAARNSRRVLAKK